jgi:DNA-binding transcriptional ArsR family regulator
VHGVDPVFSALSDATRRRLLEELARRDSASLSELAAGLPVTRQAVAKHLGALARAGLVESARAGRETRFRLTPRPLDDAAAWIERIGARWDDRLGALHDHLASDQSGRRRGPP